jgi:hypothetical protein
LKRFIHIIISIASLYLLNYYLLSINISSGDLPSDFYIEDMAGRGSRLNPARVHEVVRSGHKFKVVINENGHRESQFNFDKNFENILIIGSSVAFGYGLNYKESIIGLLEQQYKNQYNFINASSYGYGSYHSLLTLINECNIYSPKYVIYIYEYKNSRDDFLRLRSFHNSHKNIEASFNFKDFLLLIPTRQYLHNNNLHPTQIYEKIIGISNLSEKYKSKYFYNKELDGLIITNVKAVSEQVKSMSVISEMCGAKFLLIITPSPNESYYGISEPSTNYLIAKLPLIETIDLREVNSLGKDLFLKGLDYPGKDANLLYKTYINNMNFFK